MGHQAAIQVNKLSFRYGKKEVFRDISFTIAKGEIFALLGPNGCGKTTLINCILNFLKPAQGTIIIEGQDIKALKSFELAQKIAYVPQNHKKTFPYKVKEIVLMGRAAYIPTYSSPKENDMEMAMEAMKMVGIEHLAEQPYVYLSGGESQLVMLARAIAQQANIIALDEPTAHLDSYNELLVMDKLTQLIMEKGLTVIMSTHSPNQMFYLTNKGLNVHGALMNKGHFLSEGTAVDILTEENMANLYNIKCKLAEVEYDNGEKIKQLITLGANQIGEK